MNIQCVHEYSSKQLITLSSDGTPWQSGLSRIFSTMTSNTARIPFWPPSMTQTRSIVPAQYTISYTPLLTSTDAKFYYSKVHTQRISHVGNVLVLPTKKQTYFLKMGNVAALINGYFLKYTWINWLSPWSVTQWLVIGTNGQMSIMGHRPDLMLPSQTELAKKLLLFSSALFQYQIQT